MTCIDSVGAQSAIRSPARWALAGIAIAVLSACQPKEAPPAATPAAQTEQPAAASPVSYKPPTADVLYQMVAPIALYPDKLVALVLAGAIHPDEVTSAYNWLAQNPSVSADAVNQQPWDPSIKSLTTFPNALNLLQSNLPWTTALGQAYNNDPTDVLNAVQVMRQRAQQAGHLQSNTHLRVASAPSAALTGYTASSSANVVYSGPAVVTPPANYISIEPTQPQTIYVPSYDPQVVYGAPVAYYQGYSYRPPVVSNSLSPVAIGALAFGAGVVITSALDHHDWGWNSWGVHWGDAPAQARWHAGEAPLPPIARPSVSYRQSTYVSHVSTVVNNNTYINNHNVYGGVPQPAAASPVLPGNTQNTSAALTAGPSHHEGAALAGAAVAGGAIGAMALHHGATQQPPATPQRPLAMNPPRGGFANTTPPISSAAIPAGHAAQHGTETRVAPESAAALASHQSGHVPAGSNFERPPAINNIERSPTPGAAGNMGNAADFRARHTQPAEVAASVQPPHMALPNRALSQPPETNLRPPVVQPRMQAPERQEIHQAQAAARTEPPQRAPVFEQRAPQPERHQAAPAPAPQWPHPQAPAPARHEEHKEHRDR